MSSLTVLTLKVFILARKQQNTKILLLTSLFFFRSVCTQQMIKHPVVVDQGPGCILRA